MKSYIFWDIVLCWKSSDVLEDHVAYTFMAED
jgi:hypothetical protein